MSSDTISVKVIGMDILQNMLAAYPKQLKAMTYKLTTDLAVDFKRKAPSAIAKHETVRQPSFVSGAMKFERAKSASDTGLDGIQSSAGSVAGGSSSKYGENFTGWAEQIDPSLKVKRQRVIGPASRGGSMGGMVKRSMRLDPSKTIPNARNFTGPSVKSGKKNVQFMASLWKKRYRGVFILEKEGFDAGLYTFSDKMDKEKQWFPQPIRLQRFGAEIKGPVFDWREETLELVRKTFTTQAIFDNYVAVALNKARAEAKSKGGKIMDLKTPTEVAQLAHVTASAVNHWIKNNGVEPDEIIGRKKLYDIDSDPIASYIAGGDKPAGNEWDLLYKQARAEKLQIQNKKALDELINRKAVTLMMGRVYSVHTSVLTPLSSKIMGLVAAEAKIKDPKIILKMSEIMDDEIYDALSAIKRHLIDFNESLKKGEIEEVDELEFPDEDVKPSRKSGSKALKKPKAKTKAGNK